MPNDALTVKKLIELLQQFDQDCLVYSSEYDDYGNSKHIKSVDYSKDWDGQAWDGRIVRLWGSF